MYGPVNFWRKIATPNFPKKTSNFYRPTRRPYTFFKKNPVSTNFYVWTCKLFEKNATRDFPKKPLRLLYDPPIEPTLFLKKKTQLVTN
jgi:hypothetical protein